MTDKQQQLEDEAPTPLSGFFAILATVVAICVAVLISPAGNYAGSEASAAPMAAAAPDQAASAEEHAAFIHQGHERAAREGDASPLPPTF
jgi:hypothetical protein